MGSGRTMAWLFLPKQRRRKKFGEVCRAIQQTDRVATWKRPIKGIIVASIYLPNGNPRPSPNFDYKLAWFERLIKHGKVLHASGRPVVPAGDFNVVPTDADIYSAWLWRADAVMQPEVRDAYRRLLAQGWTDATRSLHPKKRIYTYWVNAAAFQRNAGFRMDFLLVSNGLAPKVIEAEVDAEFRGRERPSDHAPTWITLSEASSRRLRVQT
jgi:exodeoxyribonuclease III